MRLLLCSAELHNLSQREAAAAGGCEELHPWVLPPQSLLEPSSASLCPGTGSVPPGEGLLNPWQGLDSSDLLRDLETPEQTQTWGGWGSAPYAHPPGEQVCFTGIPRLGVSHGPASHSCYNCNDGKAPFGSYKSSEIYWKEAGAPPLPCGCVLVHPCSCPKVRGREGGCSEGV